MLSIYKKIFIVCLFGGIVLLACGIVYSIKQWIKNDSDQSVDYFDNFIENVNSSIKLKYILQWTPAHLQPFVFMGVGRKGFLDRKCEYNNCVVTSRRDLLGDLTEYDVIVFDGPALLSMPMSNENFPVKRSPRQKYVFTSMESSYNYPICSNRLDNFFNWTWTYRCDSDARWGYLLIKDSNDVVIGPNRIMHWIKLEDMKPVSEVFKEKLMSKSRAAAWFVSNCNDNGRFTFANKLKEELKKYYLDIDIYGRCGPFKCELARQADCDKMIADKYYFYLAFENSFSEDYVTEKLLRALKNDAVPIVFGGANYTRFMPDGIYLNARELGPERLAAKMDTLIKNPDQYINFFRWKNHYSYHSREDTPENNDYCNFCAMINDEERMRRKETIKDLRVWWDPPGRC